jgi:hypothetical protein
MAKSISHAHIGEGIENKNLKRNEYKLASVLSHMLKIQITYLDDDS